MCGIAGILASRQIERLAGYLDGFSAALRHRGPDDHGFLTWQDGGEFSLGRDAAHLTPGRVALVHRRLSIIDLSEQGWQPMVDATGRYAIVFNGEIYNYKELRAELEQSGVRFRSQADTEVLLQLLARQGADGLARVTGMFAFVFIDREKRRALLARDPFGIKPLYFVRGDGSLAFSSEIRPLVDLGFVPRVVEPSALFRYLRHAVTDAGEETLVVGIRQLPAAHALEVDLATGRVGIPRRYWTPRPGAASALGFDDAAARLRSLFETSVALHLRADVPVAATLSGGIDSSAIVAVARRGDGAAPQATFSYVTDDPVIGEERYVDIVAGATGIAPRKIRLDPAALAEELDGLILTQEQPFVSTSIWAQSHVFRRVREDGFKVVLDGQGADELFAGYPIFRIAQLACHMRRGDWHMALALARSLPAPRRAAILQAFGSLIPAAWQAPFRRLVGRPIVADWLDQGWFRRHDAALERPFDGVGGKARLADHLYDAAFTSSLPMLLRYADRNAMAVSLENRVPFLTTALAEFALSLPDAFLVAPDGTLKSLLRAAMRGIVPDAVLDRRDKIGFVTPESRWFAESAVLRERFAAVAARPLPACFTPSLRQRLEDAAANRVPFDPVSWRCWNALRWAELMRIEIPA